MTLRGFAGLASACLTLPAAQTDSAGRLAINGTGAAQKPGAQVDVA